MAHGRSRSRSVPWALFLLLALPALTSGTAAAGPSHSPTLGGTSGSARSVDWHNLTSKLSPAPPAMNGQQMVYDLRDGYLFQFGGYGANGSSNQSWKFDAAGWSLVPTKGSPPALNLGAMAYDPADKSVVLFGGNDNVAVNTGPTWTYVHDRWTSASPSTPPPGRSNAMMAYDAHDGYTILYGGCGPPGGGGPCYLLGGTWAYRAGNWTPLSVTTSPPRRSAAAMAYDPDLGGVILFGGCGSADYRGCTTTGGGTWEFSNGDWTKLSTTGSPPGRYGASMTFDPKAGGLILFGGSVLNGTLFHDTWLLKGTHWVRLHPSSSPPGIARVRMGYDPALGEIVLFGGIDGNGTDLRQTWVLR